MAKITVENIEKELHKVMEYPLSCDSLEKIVLLHRAKKYIERTENEFTEEDAVEWAEHMSPPARWTMEQTTDVMRQKNYHHRPCEFYAVMNALFSDYGKTVTKYGQDKPDFWAEMAHDWLCDKDAVPDKVSAYFHKIVKHD